MQLERGSGQYCLLQEVTLLQNEPRVVTLSRRHATRKETDYPSCADCLPRKIRLLNPIRWPREVIGISGYFGNTGKLGTR